MTTAGQFRLLVATNFREFGRDRLAALFTFIFPLLFVVIFGASTASQPIPRVVLGIDDRDHSERSQALVTRLFEIHGVEARLLGVAGGPAGFRFDELDATLTISKGAFTRDVVEVELIAAPAKAAFVEHAVTAVGLDVQRADVPGARSFKVVMGNPPPSPNPFRFALPGLLALALLQLGLFGTATPLVNARRHGILMYLSLTPVKHHLVLAAQVCLRLAIAMIQIALMLAIGVLAFGLPCSIELAMVGGVGLLGAVMMIAIGYALAGIVPARDSGLSLITLLNFAMLFGGGIFFSAVDSPLWPVPLALPVSYLADLGRQVLGGRGMVPAWVDVVAMIAITAGAIAVALRTFRFQGER